MKSSKKKKKRSHVFANSLIVFSLVLLGMFVVFASTPDNSTERYYAPLVTYQPEATQTVSNTNGISDYQPLEDWLSDDKSTNGSSNGSSTTKSYSSPSKSSYSSSVKRQNSNFKTYEVIAAAKDIVKEGMYNPKSADFPGGTDEYNITEHDGVWYVQGYVYGTNAYGATIKSEWLAIFELEKIKDGYRIFNYSLGWF